MHDIVETETKLDELANDHECPLDVYEDMEAQLISMRKE